MLHVSNARLSVPKAFAGEVYRRDLVKFILHSDKMLSYIHAGAGYGKTTLLSQLAKTADCTVWVTFDGENDVFSFLNTVTQALNRTFPNFLFNPSEYLPFENHSSFVTILANAFISSIEKYEKCFVMVLDDLHTIENEQIRKLISCIIKYKPDNIWFCLSSREAPWQELIPFRLRNSVLELTQRELAFTREELTEFLGIDDEYIFRITEGWPIAVASFKVLLENGVSTTDIPSCGSEMLHSYLFYECVSRLSQETVEFLKSSACFEELDPQMLDVVADKKNAKLLLESLALRNIFTSKTDGGHYRYHPLFKDYLRKQTDSGQAAALRRKAACYYFDQKQYSKSAEYAMQSGDQTILGKIIIACYRDYIRNGRFNELRMWLQVFEDEADCLNHELLVAKGSLLSSIGHFTEAKECLDLVMPLLGEDSELYLEAAIHKARVLRNFISFEESNNLLDELLLKLDRFDSEQVYNVVIEKIYNLCWNSQINEAYALSYRMIEICAEAGNVRVRAWYERYLSVIHYVAGRMKDSVYCYEKSLNIPENERLYLDMHSVDIYVAKSYQMMGQREKAVAMVTAGLQRLRITGRYEELWLGYLFAAEIHYQNTAIDRANGCSQSFETTIRYFSLADEYAPLYRKSKFQMDWATLQRNIYGLMFANIEKEKMIEEIYKTIPRVSDHFKTVALGRLYNYLGSISDFPRAAECAKRSIEIGERANIMMIATMAYGFLARIALSKQEDAEASLLIRRFLQLCNENGIYEYFRMRKAYDPILEFAWLHDIETEFTKQMMDFAGYTVKKAYITTLGSFAVFSYENRQEPLKMRTKKERELLAFLLCMGSEGATKEQIYEALWYESESNDVKKLIGVNLAHLKKDLCALGVANPILNQEKHYRICRDEIVTDVDLFEEAAAEFKRQSNYESAQKVIALYNGEYLSEFEAHWAIHKRIAYRAAYHEAIDFCVSRKV
jgi:hypothetical protein